MSGNYRGNGCAHRILFADVADVQRSVATLSIQFPLHRYEPVQVAPQQGNAGAETSQFMCRAASDTAASASDQHYLVGKQTFGKYRAIAHVASLP